jgi:hypothetical protein
MSGSDTSKSLDQTVPAADRSIQKECGMISEHWRQANERYRCASRLFRVARSQANIHTAAAEHTAEPSSASVCNDFDYGGNDVKLVHELMSKRYLGIAEAHMKLAKEQQEEASYFATMLSNKLTDRLVRQRLDALDPETVATVTRVFGRDLTDPLTRVRVFEVCDWLQFGGGVEDDLTRHVSISLRRE